MGGSLFFLMPSMRLSAFLMSRRDSATVTVSSFYRINVKLGLQRPSTEFAPPGLLRCYRALSTHLSLLPRALSSPLAPSCVSRGLVRVG